MHETMFTTLKDIVRNWRAATVDDLLPEHSLIGLQCWATPLELRAAMWKPDATQMPCKRAGTGRLGLCDKHAAEFIDPPAVADETAA